MMSFGAIVFGAPITTPPFQQFSTIIETALLSV